MIYLLDNTALAAIGAALIAGPDAGSGPGVLECYSGAILAAPSASITTQTLLGVLTLSRPCATYANKLVTFAPIAPDLDANATGTITWCLLRDSNGVARQVLDAGTTESTAAVRFANVNIIAGGSIEIASLTITIGA